MDIATAIAIGVQGDKWRKEFRSQANLYRPALENLAENLLPTLQPLLNQTGNVLQWSKIALGSLAFTQAAAGLAIFINVYTGIKAQRELAQFYTKLGHDVEKISESLQSISASVDVIANHAAQQEFGAHVYKYVKMRGQQLSAEPDKHLLFVYQPGTEWHPEFLSMVQAAPIPQLCGIFHDLDVMATWLQVIRKVVGPEPTFHILMPSTEVYVVHDPITWPEEVRPMVFEGEKCNRGGMPYVHLNMQGAPSEMFSLVKNIADEQVVAPPKSRVWRKIASTSAAWATGVPAAIVATPGGAIAGLVGFAVLAPVAAPAGALVGTVCGAGIAAGAAAGTITGLFVGTKVEECWDSKEK